MPENNSKFCSYPDGVIYKEKGGVGKTNGKTSLTQLIFGDHLYVDGNDGDWLRVFSRGVNGWIHESEIQDERILEINFVDVGQGDGVHVVTPDDKAMIIDAGEKDNMYRFLRWRYSKNKKFTEEVRLYAAVISHPDKDHYYGFKKIFDEEFLYFDHLIHNGLVERKVRAGGGIKKLGEIRNGYVTGVVRNKDDLNALLKQLESDNLLKGSLYTTLLNAAVKSSRYARIHSIGNFPDIESISYFPGFAKEDNPDFFIEVLGPVFEGTREHPKLKVFQSLGKTKNGHSVILRVHMGGITILLGGDLNIPAEKYLLSRYTGIDINPDSAGDKDRLIGRARYFFESDFAKACHHGSSDFTEEFLKAINARATVISSGDNEPHNHPRPDTLGALGKYGRGIRPLIFSTELARAYDTKILNPYQLQTEIEKNRKIIDSGTASENNKKQAMRKLQPAKDLLGKSIARYGMICLRTDGNKAIVAQKLERYRGKGKKWSISQFERDEITNELFYLSPH